MSTQIRKAATTPRAEEGAARARLRALGKARSVKARKAAQADRQAARDLDRRLVRVRREAARLQGAYDRVDLDSDEAVSLQAQLLSALAAIRRLERAVVNTQQKGRA